MHTLRKKIKSLNLKVKDNKNIIIIQEKNKKINNSENFQVNTDINYSCSNEEIDDFVNENSFKIIENINGKDFLNISVKSSDNKFYIKDNITDDFYISSSEDLGDDIKKIIVMRKEGKYCDYYSYLMRNDENELIKIAIISLDNSSYLGSKSLLNNYKKSDLEIVGKNKNNKNDSLNLIGNNKFKKIVVTNTKIEGLNNTDLLEYGQEKNLGMLNYDLEDFADMNIETEEQNVFIQEVLKNYKVKVNGEEILNNDSTKEVGNAMMAVDEEEYYREDMLYLLSDLRNLIKIKIESSQGIKYDLKSNSEEREI